MTRTGKITRLATGSGEPAAPQQACPVVDDPTPRSRRRLCAALALAFVVVLPAAIAHADALDLVRELEYERAAPAALAESLADPDANVRRAAAFALGRMPVAGNAALLAPLLEDPEADVRHAAAFSLGQQADTTAVQALTSAALASDKALAEESVYALGKIGGADAARVLGEFLEHERSAVRRAAALSLARMADTTQVARVAARLESETSSSVRWTLLRALESSTGTPELTTAVAADLDARSPLVRAQAARTLGRLGDPSATRPLLALLIDSQWRVRVQACGALGAIGSTAAVEALMPLVADPVHHVREAAISAIGAIGDDVPLTLLERAAADPAIGVRRQTATALATIETDGTLGLVESFLRDPAPAVRAAAVATLATRTGEEAIDRLLDRTAKTEDAPVRCAAVGALGELADISALVTLIELLEDDDWVVATLAAEALGELGDDAAQSSLIAAFESRTGFEEFDVRLAVTEALGRVGGARSRGVLLEAALDRDPRLRELARAAIDSLTARMQGEVPETWAYEDSVIAAGPFSSGGPRLGAAPASFPKTDPALPTRARIVTERGLIEVELFPELAPMTVQSFVELARAGFHAGASFHRVVPDFVVQGGCPRGDGWGGPGYALRSEWNPKRYDAGTLGMAHAGPDTGGSQFFITHSPQPHLDGRYTVFGRVVSGMSVVDALEQGDHFSVIIAE